MVNNVCLKNKNLIIELSNEYTSVLDSINYYHSLSKPFLKIMDRITFRSEGPYHYGGWYKNYSSKQSRRCFDLFEEVGNIDTYTSDYEAVQYSANRLSENKDRLKYISAVYIIEDIEFEMEIKIADELLKEKNDIIKIEIKNGDFKKAVDYLQRKLNIFTESEYDSIEDYLKTIK